MSKDRAGEGQTARLQVLTCISLSLPAGKDLAVVTIWTQEKSFVRDSGSFGEFDNVKCADIA